MSYPFDPPAGDVASLQSAAKGLAAVATDLNKQISGAKSATTLALQEWTGPRSDDFTHAGQALVDELDMIVTSTGSTANLIGEWASRLQTAITDIASYKTNYDNVQQPTGPDPTGNLALTAAKQQSNWVRQAITAHHDLNSDAQKFAAAIAQETDLAVPHSSTLSPAEIARRVDSSLGMDNFTRGEYFNGEINDDAAWAMLHTADGSVYDAGTPVPGDSGFQAWYAALTPAQQLLEVQKLQASFDPSNFDPYKSIQGGQLPQWAQTFNAEHQSACVAGDELTPGWGYFGGGTIAGPGGKQWPIVMPYYSNGHVMYMDDYGQGRTDGGIDQMDGTDPGWHTVSVYSGGGSFGSISMSTKIAAGLLIGTGQDLEVRQVDPGAVAVDPNGMPYAGHDVQSIPSGPPDKAWWDVDSDSMMPKPLENLPSGSIQPNLEYNEAALGANALLIQTGQALVAAHELDQHAQREWYVDYQVNDDGRTRAIVHTYTAGPLDDGKTGVLALANAFPTGQSGSTNEVPYKSRFNPYTQTVATAMPDPNVEYSNKDPEPDAGLGGLGYITEKLNK